MADTPHAPKNTPATTTPQGGMVVPTPQGPQSQIKEESQSALSVATEAEQKAGREAVERAQGRIKREQEVGTKEVERMAASAPPPRRNPLHGG